MEIDPISVSNSFKPGKDRLEESHGNQLFTTTYQEIMLLSFVVARSLSNQDMEHQELVEL